MQTTLAAQMYTLREFMKTPYQMAVTLKKVKALGYDAVQLSGQGPVEPQAMADMINENDLYVCATHISYDAIKDDIDSVIKTHKLWGCPYVGVGALPARFREGGAEGYAAFAKEASHYGKLLKQAGLTFVYHNHNFEFERMGHRTGMEILLQESDPEGFTFEMDTYWVQAGGADPIAWIRKLKGRMEIIHFKDMAIRDRSQVFAEIGEGNMNFAGIIEACRELNLKWHIIEEDTCPGDPFDSLAISLRNLRTMGMV